MLHNTTVLRQKNRQRNGLISRFLFPELYKIMVNKVTFLGLKGGDRPNLPLLICSWYNDMHCAEEHLPQRWI